MLQWSMQHVVWYNHHLSLSPAITIFPSLSCLLHLFYSFICRTKLQLFFAPSPFFPSQENAVCAVDVCVLSNRRVHGARTPTYLRNMTGLSYSGVLAIEVNPRLWNANGLWWSCSIDGHRGCYEQTQNRAHAHSRVDCCQNWNIIHKERKHIFGPSFLAAVRRW